MKQQPAKQDGSQDYHELEAGESRACRFDRHGLTVHMPSHPRKRRVTAQAPGAVPPRKEALGINVIRAVAHLTVTADGAPVTTFDPPLTLVLDYTAADENAAGGTSRLKVFFYDPDTSLWAHFPHPTIDTSARTATVTISKLLGEHDPVGFDY
ncbi:MAG: hypothetical protein HZB53_21770 [Chloroflexi bacterium]|nr:hypothetical protein [Chloroflexota bacterium]